LVALHGHREFHLDIHSTGLKQSVGWADEGSPTLAARKPGWSVSVREKIPGSAALHPGCESEAREAMLGFLRQPNLQEFV